MPIQPQTSWRSPTPSLGVKFSGSAFTANLATAFSSGSLSLSTSQVTELSLTFIDSDDMFLARSYVTARGVTVTCQGWVLEVRGREANADGGTVTVKARSKRAGKLKDQTGKKSWGKQTITSWVRSEARWAGFKRFLIEPSTAKATITRAGKSKDQEAESSWDVLSRYRDQLGYQMFEYGDTFVFGRRKWIASQGQEWSWSWKSRNDYSETLAGSPRYSYSADSSPRESLTLPVQAVNASDIRPGDTIKLSGAMSAWNGKWFVTGVDIPLRPNETVEVTATRL